MTFISPARALVAWAILSLAACAGSVQEQPTTPTVESRGRSEYGAVEYVKTSLRRNATQGFLLLHARAPVGSVILFTGGDGVLNLEAGGTLKNGGNFLVRVRMDFVAAGYNVAVVDTPSDQESLRFFRTSLQHATDIKGVMQYMRGLSNGPVWLVGTSRGTVSVANVAARLTQEGPDGIVLTSTITGTDNAAVTSVYNTNLAGIRVPVLIVSHTSDLCPASRMGGSEVLTQKMKNTTEVEFLSFSGGKPAESGPCDPFSPHGYFGVEPQATSAIISWIQASKRSQSASK